MKITLKTLKKAKYELEVDPSSTILMVKEKIDSELGLGKPNGLKLIYQGKILRDDQIVQDCNLNGFVVLLGTKAPKVKPAAAAPAADAAAASASASSSSSASAAAAPAAASSSSSASPAPADAAASATERTDASTAAAPATAAATSSAESTTTATAAVPAAQEETIANLVALGFPRPRIERALALANGDADRAYSILQDGIQGLGGASGGSGSGNGAGPATGDPEPAAPSGGDDGSPTGSSDAHPASGSPLSALGLPGSIPEVAQALQSQPQLLQQLMQQILQSNPQIINAAGGDPQRLATMLRNPDVIAILLALVTGGPDGMPGAPRGGGGGGGGAPGAGQQVVELAPEDMAVIESLMTLGFPRDRAIEAYLVCGKNYEQAADYLFRSQE